MKQITALKRAIKIRGSQYGLAKKMECDPSSVNKWLKKARTLAVNQDLFEYKFAVKLQEATNNQVLAEWLIPECFKSIKKCEKNSKKCLTT